MQIAGDPEWIDAKEGNNLLKEDRIPYTVNCHVKTN